MHHPLNESGTMYHLFKLVEEEQTLCPTTLNLDMPKYFFFENRGWSSVASNFLYNFLHCLFPDFNDTCIKNVRLNSYYI